VARVADEHERAVIRLAKNDMSVAGQREAVEGIDVREHLLGLRAQSEDAVPPRFETALDDGRVAVVTLTEEEVAASRPERQEAEQVARPAYDLPELSLNLGRPPNRPQRAVGVLVTPADEAAPCAETRRGAVGSDDELERPMSSSAGVGERAAVMRDDLGRDACLGAGPSGERDKRIVERGPRDTEPAKAGRSVGVGEVEDDPAAARARDDAVDLLRASGDLVEDSQAREHALARRLQEDACADGLERRRLLEDPDLVTLLGEKRGRRRARDPEADDGDPRPAHPASTISAGSLPPISDSWLKHVAVWPIPACVHSGSWLFPDGADRERMLELDRYLRPVRRAAFGVLAVTLLASGPWLGWWTLIPLGLAIIGFRLADTYMDRMQRPEYALFAAWVASEVIMALAVALSGGPRVPTTAWLAIPVLTLGARFSHRGIALGVGVALVLLLAVEFGVDAQAVVDNPPLLLAPASLIVCVAMFQVVLMRSELRLRSEIVIDGLTGTFNRKALVHRVDELTQQSQITRQPIGLILGDIDHFKSINDSYGHATGDAVLTDVAYRMRKTLRAFDLCYRTGGEEFLVLLPGATLDESVDLAEQLRAAIAAEPCAGQDVTMSFGTAASAPGDALEYDVVFAEADAALYEAKRSGRNRVCAAGARAAHAA
jgi:diguanylate cyclase (GGDEF)-like protein